MISLQLSAATCNTNSNEAGETKSRKKPAAAFSLILDQQPSIAAEDPSADKRIGVNVKVVSAPGRDWYDKATVWINAALALVGLIGIVTALGSLRVLRRQVGHMEAQTYILRDSVAAAQKSAEAAFLNAQALIDAERARLIVSCPRIGPFRFKLRITNVGRSPALIRFSLARLSLLESAEVLPEIPFYETEDAESGWMGTEQWLLPNHSVRLNIKELWREIDLSDSSRPSLENEPVLESKAQAWVFGYLRYKDSLSPSDRITRFCYGSLFGETKIWMLRIGTEAYSGDT